MPAPNHDFPHKWVQESLDENLEPFLLQHPGRRDEIEIVLEQIAERPYAPPHPWFFWKGEESDLWRVVVVEDLRIVYEPSPVHPWVGLVSITLE